MATGDEIISDARDQLAVCLAGGTEEGAALEIEQVDKVVDDPAQISVHDQAVEVRIHLKAVDHVEPFEDRHHNRDQPNAFPVVGRFAIKGDHVFVEDLVPDRLIKEAVIGNADGRAVAVGDPFRLEEQRLSEAFCRGDDELIAPLLLEEVLDPRGAVEERDIQIVGDLNVVGINCPGSHGAVPTDTN